LIFRFAGSCLERQARLNSATVSAVRFVFVAALTVCCFGASIDDQQFNGRWDIIVNGPSTPRGWWLEVSGAGTDNLKGKFLGAPVGLLDEIPKLSISGGELRFALEGRFRKDHGLEKGLYWARLDDGKLKGTFEVEGNPSTYLEWTGMRAPALAERDDSSWKRGDPVALFNGRDLAGWQAVPPAHLLAWVVRDEALTSLPGAPDIVSDKKFLNFVADVEYRIEPHTNSGIGLRGRYEFQITDDADRPSSKLATGAILGRVAPTLNAARPAGEWQMLAIRLVGREVTVILNGIRVINRQSIQGPTAIALDANEAEPGPILLQGGRGTIEFRRIVVYPLVKKP
jgi:3-keto-disaccharide hydrolase